MALLKRNKLLMLFLLSSISGCATSSFKVLHQTDTAMEFAVTPDRVAMECEKVETDDRGFVYGFMLHVLDEEKTSFTLVQTNNLDKESCDLRILKIGKILREGSQIYLAGVGDFREPRKKGLRKYLFPQGYSVEDNGRSLQFIAVKNNHDQCYSAFTAEELPCPPRPFPLKK